MPTDYKRVKDRNKAIKILEILNGDASGKIDLIALRKASFRGIPDTNKSG